MWGAQAKDQLPSRNVATPARRDADDALASQAIHARAAASRRASSPVNAA